MDKVEITLQIDQTAKALSAAAMEMESLKSLIETIPYKTQDADPNTLKMDQACQTDPIQENDPQPSTSTQNVKDELLSESETSENENEKDTFWKEVDDLLAEAKQDKESPSQGPSKKVKVIKRKNLGPKAESHPAKKRKLNMDDYPTHKRKQSIIDNYMRKSSYAERKKWRITSTKTIKTLKEPKELIKLLDNPPIPRQDRGPCKRWNMNQICYDIEQGEDECSYKHTCTECFFIFKKWSNHKFGIRCPVVTLLERATRAE